MQNAIAIKFGKSGKVHFIPALENVENLNVNNKLIVNTTRGLEVAIVVKPQNEVEKENLTPVVLNFVRVASQKDLEFESQLFSKKDEIINKCKNIIDKLKLDMRIVDVEFTIDGQKLIISYVCEQRVDFRELVKQLANEFKQKIELKQIGARDHAKIVGGIGACGQECCCIRYLSDFDKVSVKMAKNQNLSLNPVKINGLCGRLMCCLSYENDTYSEINAKMPKIGSSVVTPNGEGVVVYNDLLKQRVSVKLTNAETKFEVFDLNVLEFNKTHTNQKACKGKQCGLDNANVGSAV